MWPRNSFSKPPEACGPGIFFRITWSTWPRNSCSNHLKHVAQEFFFESPEARGPRGWPPCPSRSSRCTNWDLQSSKLKKCTGTRLTVTVHDQSALTKLERCTGTRLPVTVHD
jgi:hypothetical protein